MNNGDFSMDVNVSNHNEMSRSLLSAGRDRVLTVDVGDTSKPSCLKRFLNYFVCDVSAESRLRKYPKRLKSVAIYLKQKKLARELIQIFKDNRNQEKNRHNIAMNIRQRLSEYLMSIDELKILNPEIISNSDEAEEFLEKLLPMLHKEHGKSMEEVLKYDNKNLASGNKMQSTMKKIHQNFTEDARVLVPRMFGGLRETIGEMYKKKLSKAKNSIHPDNNTKPLQDVCKEVENKYASRWRTLGHLLSGPVGVAVGGSITVLSAMTGVVMELYYTQENTGGDTNHEKMRNSFNKAFAVSAISAIATVGTKLLSAIISNKADNSEKLLSLQNELKQIESFYSAETDKWLDTLFGTDPSEEKALKQAIDFIENYQDELMKVNTDFQQSKYPEARKFKRFHEAAYVGNTLIVEINSLKEQNSKILELLGNRKDIDNAEPDQQFVEQSKSNENDCFEKAIILTKEQDQPIVKQVD